jgi:DNA polymerase-3 subunit alpha
MFAVADGAASIPEPTLPTVEPWSALEQLHHEKEVIGFYLSGHPLDDHRLEIKHLCNTTLPELKDLDKLAGRELCFSGIVTRPSTASPKAANNSAFSAWKTIPERTSSCSSAKTT